MNPRSQANPDDATPLAERAVPTAVVDDTFEFADLASAYLARRSDGRELVDALHQRVRRACATYPEFYFEGGVRTDDAVRMLTHEVFRRAAQEVLAALPYAGRTRLEWIATCRPADRLVVHLLVRGTHAVLRRVLHEQRVRATASDPVRRAQEVVWRDVMAAVPFVCVKVPVPFGAPERWRAPHPTRTEPLPGREVVAQLKAMRTRDVRELVRHAAAMLARPFSAVALARILVEVLGDAPGHPESPARESAPSGYAAVAVRRACRSVWGGLSEPERVLLRDVAGLPRPRALPRDVTRVLDREDLRSRELAAIEEKIAKELGGARSRRPKQTAELFIEVLRGLPDSPLFYTEPAGIAVDAAPEWPPTVDVDAPPPPPGPRLSLPPLPPTVGMRRLALTLPLLEHRMNDRVPWLRSLAPSGQAWSTTASTMAEAEFWEGAWCAPPEPPLDAPPDATLHSAWVSREARLWCIFDPTGGAWVQLDGPEPCDLDLEGIVIRLRTAAWVRLGRPAARILREGLNELLDPVDVN